MASPKSLVTRFYQPQCGHAPTRAYQKLLGHHKDVEYMWRLGFVAQTFEHLLWHCSEWMFHQWELWRQVGKATGWKTGQCRWPLVSELFCVECFEKSVMDFQMATDVGKFPLGWGMESGAASCSFLCLFVCQWGQWVVGGSSAIYPAHPEAQGIMASHSVPTINTVWINNINIENTCQIAPWELYCFISRTDFNQS